MSALRRARIDRHMSVVQLSEVTGLSQEAIRNIESGRARNPRSDTLSKLAKALEVLPSEIDPMSTEQAPA